MKRLTLPLVLMFALVWLAGCRTDEATAVPTIVPTSVPAATTPVQPETDSGDTAAANAGSDPTPTAAPQPTATPQPPKDLVVCLAQEPANLYLYGDNSLAATAVRHAIYENLFTELGYAYQPQGLAKLPTLADGDIAINNVPVAVGDRVVDATGAVVTLAVGTELRAASGETVLFDGDTAVTLPQMTVDFALQPLVWSDGTAVTAADSIFSYQIAADPDTSGSRARVNRTASYEASGNLTLRWTGVPGFVTANVVDYVWQPLPAHQLGSIDSIQLASVPEAAQRPLSSGPFVVSDWQRGDSIVMTPNPFYYRAADGLPHLDSLTFRFLPADFDPANPLSTPDWTEGNCDVITQDAFFVESLPSLDDAGVVGDAVVQTEASPIFEHIAFGVNSYGVYGDGRERPDWFEDVRVRQGMTLCTNRQAMVDSLLNGRSAVMHSFVPDNHPLYPASLPAWDYDPAAGQRLLDEAGYIDSDGDGVREDPVTARPFRISLLTDNGNDLRLPITEQFRDNMAACGIQVDLLYVAPPELYADGPAGTVFGRSFDLAQFAWISGVEPPCHLWLTRNITGPRGEGFGGWGNVNPTGWSSSSYDAACEAAIASPADSPDHAANHQQAMTIFANELPIIPLFAYPKVTVARPTVQNLILDPSQLSELWNVAAFDMAE